MEFQTMPMVVLMTRIRLKLVSVVVAIWRPILMAMALPTVLIRMTIMMGEQTLRKLLQDQTP
jgi:hypothetical protein